MIFEFDHLALGGICSLLHVLTYICSINSLKYNVPKSFDDEFLVCFILNVGAQ